MKSKYRSDLFDLFGNPDGSKRGYLGSKNEPICWDWGINGFRKIINIMHSLSGADPKKFQSFYDSKIIHKDNVVQTLLNNNIIDASPQMLYVFKQGTRKIPAFTSTIDEISWRSGRIYISYRPTRYMLLDPSSWRQFWDQLFTDGREDPQKWFALWDNSWSAPRPSISQLRMMLRSSASQDQYHLIPYRVLAESIHKKIEDEEGVFFVKVIAKASKRIRLQVSTDNQVFWSLLSEFIGRAQVRGTVELGYGLGKYMIVDIPANTISEDSLVFKQEVGAARTICQAMLDVFGEEYLSAEFPAGTLTKNILDSKFLKRAVQVSMVTKGYDRKYAETDFDYQLILDPLQRQAANVRKKKILFDLTAGLWNKGIGGNKEEFIEKWQHNLAKLPEKNSDLVVFWHYGLMSEVKDGSYQGQELGDYIRSRANIQAMRYRSGSISKSKLIPQLVLLPFFRDSETRLETELNHISSDKPAERRRSVLYSALRELLERLGRENWGRRNTITP